MNMFKKFLGPILAVAFVASVANVLSGQSGQIERSLSTLNGPVTVNGTIDVTSTITGVNIRTNPGTGQIYWFNRSVMQSPSDGVWQVANNAVTGFTRLILGTNDGTANGISFVNNGGALDIKTGDGTSLRDVNLRTLNTSGKIGQYNSVNTAGNGVQSIVAAGSGAGISAAADTNRCSFTPGADGDFEVSDNILVTTAGSIAATATIGYTDEGNTARTQTIPFVLVAGSAIVTSIAAANGTVPYNGLSVRIRAKSGVAINVSTTGTFTGSVYNHRCTISQLQ